MSSLSELLPDANRVEGGAPDGDAHPGDDVLGFSAGGVVSVTHDLASHVYVHKHTNRLW